jgi:cysteate synthase
MGDYSLICCATGDEVHQADPFDFTTDCEGSLLKAQFANTKLRVRDDLPGLWRFIDWLPVKKPNEYSFGPVTYKSKVLGKELGLSNLWLSLNGYYPDLKAFYKTCTFKELHAVVAIEYAREQGVDKLVLASAGNTGVAFTFIAELLNFPTVCVIPAKCMCGVNVPNMLIEHAKIVVLEDGDYSDALDISRRLSDVKGYVYEGGSKNFARRAGLSVPYLDAVTKIGQIPHHYFQAVGSGTGAIASWHVNELFVRDGAYGDYFTKMHLSQNSPMTPMVSAWSEGRDHLIEERDIPDTENILDVVASRVLSTKYPAYAVRGGVYDALKATDGHMYAIENQEVFDAVKLFKKFEGPDILPASGVALASLLHAIRDGKVARDDIIMLNLTGAGTAQRLMDLSVVPIKAHHIITKEITDEQLYELDV